MIDESDSASEQYNSDQAQVTMAEQVLVRHQEPVGDAEAPPVFDDYPESATRTTLVEDNYAEEESGALVYTSESDDDETRESGLDSDAASMGSSEFDYGSEREVPDSEDDEADTSSPYKVMSPYRSTATLQTQQSLTSSSPPLQTLSMASQPTVQLRDLCNLQDISGDQAPGLPPMGIPNQQFCGGPFAYSVPPPLPPRPSAPRQAPWNTPSYPPFAQQNDSQAWFPEDMPVSQSYLGTNFGDRPSLFSHAPPHPAQEMEDQRSGLMVGNALDTLQTEHRLQTPPPLPASEIMTTTPPPNRRTKVSIEEIVEEQLLTPTSVNSMKRKADVLEEEQSPPVMASPATSKEASNAVAAQEAADANATAIIAKRPKKQPRSIMGKVLKGASYPLLGAAGAVVSFTLLSTLPDAFFGA